MIAALPATAQNRSGDNAVTQAEDAFGVSIGRETLGIYSAGNARGFSPSAAGNVRIEGLYFDPVYLPTSLLAESASVKVGLSAQSYPFAAPSGIVDFSLRRPAAKAGQSFLVDSDSFGSYGLELDGSLPVSTTLGIGYGANFGRSEYPDGTDGQHVSAALYARWRPSDAIELVPFWTASKSYHDEAGPYYIPAGNYLPPQPEQRRFDGPGWADTRFVAGNHGLIARYTPAQDWEIRAGAFRSVYDAQAGYTNLLLDVTPEGAADRLIIVDPRARQESVSGELRVTRLIADGPRLHTIHLSVRGRRSSGEYGGSDEIDLGPTRIGVPVIADKPDFAFGDVSTDKVRQLNYGISYEGRWKGVGELGFGMSKADYRKRTLYPATAPIVAQSHPWIYNATAAGYLTGKLALYAGYARGLEESGVAPPNATNRNQPLPAILTTQRDAGLRYALTERIKLVAGVFDLRRPYFGYDASGRYARIGTTRNQGIEMSVSGAITPRLNMVAGGVFLKPRVIEDATAAAAVGKRPVGLPDHFINFNLNWRTPIAKGLSFDLAGVHRGKTPATTDNALYVPPRATVNLGARYLFKLDGKDALFRVQIVNLFDEQGFSIAGPGIYAANAGRYLSGYFAMDF
ncbi:TonB-dependent siderophore receptor [Hephaestia sp. GCM10023244]|uniref:TonB-dependent siderophore receptor n=1 Tax=unclassified Hephaestia TaxID=2631281 RepID=UPI0020776484|nr:TonB-dependent receptor [Hephaestia sp. MAHUQ-44]MCM8731895.1 TonB-dependent receptor [Hephaestia sp. MAHUQ-44]